MNWHLVAGAVCDSIPVAGQVLASRDIGEPTDGRRLSAAD